MNELKQELKQGVLLEGRPGLAMLSDAFEIAKRELETEKLSVHPDFLLVQAENGKRQLGVEQAEAVLSRCALRPAIAKRQVVIIDGIDRMTVAGQNKLLKMLEEEESILVLAVAYSAAVLDTIKSRLSKVIYRPLDYKQFCEYPAMSQADDTDRWMYFYLTDGCPGLVEEMDGLKPVCKDIIAAVEACQLKNLLPAMHLLTEKDKDSVAQGQYKKQVIQFLEACFASELMSLYGVSDGFLKPNTSYKHSQLVNIIDMLTEAKTKCSSSTYSKDNFFDLIMRIITA